MFNIALFVRILLGVLAFIGTIVNALVLFALFKVKLGSRLTNLLLLTQGLIDLYICIILFIYKITPVDIITGIVWLDDILCHLWYIDQMAWIGIVGSVNCLACISFDRYMAVKHPLVYKTHQRGLIIGCYIYLVGIDIFVAGPNPFLRRYQYGRCWAKFAFDGPEIELFFQIQGVFWALNAYLLPALFIIVTHVIVIWTLHKSSTAAQSGQTSSSTSSNGRRVNRRIVATTVAMATNLLSLHLYEAATYMASYTGLMKYNVGSPRQQGGVCCIVLSCIINPCIVVWFNASVKRVLVRCLGLNRCCPNYWKGLLQQQSSTGNPEMISTSMPEERQSSISSERN